jgi:long-chain acyl-CoA synthetase
MITNSNVKERERYNQLKKEVTTNDQLMFAGHLLHYAADKYGDTPALIYQDKTISFNDLYLYACQFGKGLQKQGIQPHDHVVICIENSPAFFVAYYGAWQIGAVVIPLNTFLTETELKFIVSDAKPAIIITSSNQKKLFEDIDTGDIPILTEDDMALDQKPEKSWELDTLITLPTTDMAALLYTSGTTGLPKGVMLSSKNIMTSLMQTMSRLHLNHGERVFAVLPLFHAFAQNAFVWGSIFAGVTIILAPKIERRYILEALKHKPTLFLGVPALFGLLCMMKTAPLDSVKLFVSGGDALPDKIRSYFELLYHRKICSGYGLTETSPTLSVAFEDEAMPTGNVGTLLQGIEASVRDEQNKEVPRGQIGQLWVKGDNVMLGYYNAPEMTEKVLQDGWFDTGDLVYFDDKNRLVITGRVKDLIISKGLNIYPQEVENVILSHPNVLRVGVIGKKDDVVGEVPIAFVQLRKNKEGIERKLMRLCREHLAAYKVPKQFICDTAELPVTATSKVDKKELRKRIE